MKRIVRILICAVFIQIVVCVSACATHSTSAMIARLNADRFVFCGTSYAGKKTAMISIAERLLNEGYESSFVAGVMANVACEGTYGKFENITGYTETRLREVYPNLKPCSVSGKDHQNYIAHMNGFTAYDRCGHDHSEYQMYNKKYIYNGFSLEAVGNMLDRYAGENWAAKFGLGSLQWTGARTYTLFRFYRDVAGDEDTIDYEQCAEAEMGMISYELGNTHTSVYRNWCNANPDRDSEDAAYSAGYRVCYYYEVPSDRANRAVLRGNIAREIYEVMMPEDIPEDDDPPVISNLHIEDLGFDGYTIVCDVGDNTSVDKVVFTVRSGNSLSDQHTEGYVTENTCRQRISIRDYRYETDCFYYTTVCAYDGYGNMSEEEITIYVYGGDLNRLRQNFDCVIIPENCEVIDEESFAGTSAEAVVLPDTCGFVGPNAFVDCLELQYVIVPVDVYISPDAFTQNVHIIRY